MICETNLPSKIEPNRTLTDLTLKETHLKTYPTMKAINIERGFLMIFFYYHADQKKKDALLDSQFCL